MNYFMNALTLQRWADQIDSRVMLPQLCRRLAWSLIDVTEVDFPAFESAHRAGFDGSIVSACGNAWIPAGRSYWELSVEKGVSSKADGDFKKRTMETPDDVREQSTFVFATPRFWKDKDNWASENTKDSGWKDVFAYDCDDLEQWLEVELPVAIWLGQQIGTRPDGVDTLSERWQSIANSSRRQLIPAIFLAGRNSNVESVRSWLSGEPDWLAIECRSPHEVVDFICAWSASLDESERLAVEARAVLVEDRNAWKQLRETRTGAILIVEPSVAPAAEEVRRAVSNGHKVLLACEPTSVDQRNTIKLRRPVFHELTKSLGDSGYSPVEAEQLSRAAGGSLAILKNRLSEPRTSSLPDWSKEIPPEVIATVLLLGGWSETNTADLEAFHRLSGCSYAACESKLQQLSSSRDALLLHADKKWRLISKDDAWDTFGNTVPSSSLKDFTSLAAEILIDDDPRFELPDEKRLFAQLSGHVAIYSSTLKQHVSETLALLGTIAPTLEASASINLNETVDHVVGNVLSQTSTWRRWASLGSRLPLLAEASPRAFLAAVRADLQKSEPELVKVLREEDGSLFLSNCNHAGLLWALETLAWPKQYVGEVAELLLLLSYLDPGGKWSNRPINSLSAILSWWHPQTTANCSERIQIVDLLIACHYEAAWSVLLKLMRNSLENRADAIHRPFWRDWGNGWTGRVSFDDQSRFVTAIGERIIHQAGGVPARWVQLLKRLGDFPTSLQPLLIQQADSLPSTEMTDHQRLELTDVLSNQIQAYRHPRHASDSVPATFLDAMEEILGRLKPQSEAMRSVPLFGRWPNLYLDQEGNYEAKQTALRAARIDSIERVLQNGGFDGIVQLLNHAESPLEVGNCLAELTADAFVENVVPTMLDGSPAEKEFAKGFIWNRRFHAGWSWVDSAVLLCANEDNAAFLLAATPFEAEAWERAEYAGPETADLYWMKSPAFNSELDAKSIETATRALVGHNRAPEAIDLISQGLHNNRNIETATLVLALDSLRFAPADSKRATNCQSVQYNVPRIIGALQERPDVDIGKLFQLELRYLGLLDERTGHEPKTLLQRLASDPPFFVEILSYCFRPKANEGDEVVPNQIERDPAIGRQLLRLLGDWNCLEQLTVAGRLDEKRLQDWCNECREESSRVGQLEHCDYYIGELLSRTASEPDGSWPNVAVCRVLEGIATQRVCAGFLIGVGNSREACCRGAGGDQERDLAAKYRKHANAIRFTFPLPAKLLDQLAESYDREAKTWDEHDRWEE